MSNLAAQSSLILLIHGLNLQICRTLGVIDALCLGIANLVNLTRLTLSSESIYRLSQPATTFAALAKLSELRCLELQHCELRTSINLSQWPSLQHLNLVACFGCRHVVRPADSARNPLFRWFSAIFKMVSHHMASILSADLPAEDESILVQCTKSV